MRVSARRAATWRSRSRRWIALAWLVAAGTPSGAYAQGTATPRLDSTAGEGPTAVQTGTAAVATAAVPPFWVAGVAIAPAQRSAVLVVLDDARRDVGVITLREGESYGGYRLAAVEPARVLLERHGAVVAVPVGRPHAGSKGTPDASARAGSRIIFIPEPDKPTANTDDTGPQVTPGQGHAASSTAGGSAPDPEALRNFLERVFQDPQLQQKLEEMRPRIQQRLERARGDRQGPPDAPSATSKPPQGTSP